LVVAEILLLAEPQPASNIVRMQGTKAERWILFNSGVSQKKRLRGYRETQGRPVDEDYLKKVAFRYE
jgi:hypothetical protein